MENKAFDEITKTIKDAGYVVVGLGVIGFQRAQVRRQELIQTVKSNTKGIESQVNEARDQVAKVVKNIETRFEPVRSQIEARLDDVEERLPATARTYWKQTREQTRKATDQVRSRILGSAA